RVELRRVVRLDRGVDVVVVPHHRLERRVRAVVHVGRGELDVAQRRDAEEELAGLEWSANTWVARSRVERRSASRARTDLRHGNARELLSAEEGSVVASHAARLGEEE